ncbi:MAG: endonuclease/exonuclease/phosphatase family protein [Pseudobacteriovorax sp.]|nr:endonuclease/exonuclease/phosphatase family protein [Pseudobacteriovorax sp.]
MNIAGFSLLILGGFLVSTLVNGQDRISVMAYNLENLFDTKDDPNVADETYLPLATKRANPAIQKKCPKDGRYRKSCLNLDWSEANLQAKMKNLASVVLSVNQGRGPDILILSEIENRGILETWNTKHLKAAGYQTVMHLDSGDRRGIDTAVLSRLSPAGQAKLHPVRLPEKGKTKETRGILEAPLKTKNGDLITAFAVHFPSPRHPHEQRVAAFSQLTDAAKKAKTKSAAVIAGGDFNVINRYDSLIFRGLGYADWQTSHVIGCHSCLGTHFYRDNWSFLDAILNLKFDEKTAKNSWQIDPSSVEVINSLKLQRRPQISQSPRRFEVSDRTGASDHFPIYLEIVRNKVAH